MIEIYITGGVIHIGGQKVSGDLSMKSGRIVLSSMLKTPKSTHIELVIYNKVFLYNHL